jgi:hypothetical protein
MDKPAFYVFEKKIIKKTFYKVYVDGERLCFAKLPYLERNDFWMNFPLTDWFLLFVALVIALLDLPQKKFKRKLNKREKIEQQYDTWSQQEMEKVLACDGNFAIHLNEVEKVVLIPTADYEHNRGMLRFIFAEDEARTFSFHKVHKLDRIEALLKEVAPTLVIERKIW